MMVKLSRQPPILNPPGHLHASHLVKSAPCLLALLHTRPALFGRCHMLACLASLVFTVTLPPQRRLVWHFSKVSAFIQRLENVCTYPTLLVSQDHVCHLCNPAFVRVCILTVTTPGHVHPTQTQTQTPQQTTHLQTHTESSKPSSSEPSPGQPPSL